ncbi:MAG: tRNA (N(6)-L-threonylcarbamoyladenosine(37)-C(2))-methylthiotransferase MtaB [Treponema sp.]|jgi:threonylcarbamoyladenosine tRNA methylthiotransferase MtaB|nr:tRNA (N(6)-L-threonylcarbamoyladenosine(37)-C(2))-methylthiotransferase MtaB [Treponema sp.]
MFFSIYTLGCKVNQIESEAIAAAFRDAGFTALPWGAPLDGTNAPILVINTCTVTSKAEQKARRLIRNALRLPCAALIVSGCYAELDVHNIAELATEEPDLAPLFVLGGGGKDTLLDLPGFLAAKVKDAPLTTLVSQWLNRTLVSDTSKPPPPTLVSGTNDAAFRFNMADFSFHSRASLKIQDGCDHRCSYCRVCLARGKSVSIEPQKALTSLRLLEEKGYAEATLTGINIGQYRSCGFDLGALIAYLLAETQAIRLRLSSLEPDSLSEGFIKALASPRIRPHFHLSVQSGSPIILQRMARPYQVQAIKHGIALLRSVKTDPFLACDIITGFPGETDMAFEETWSLCRRVGFAWIHAFPYSPRPGTMAYSFTGHVSERTAGARVERLLTLAREGRRAYTSRWLGKTVEAIVETHEDPRMASAVSENYLKLRIPRNTETPLKPGTLIHCRLSGQPESESKDNTNFDALAQAL